MNQESSITVEVLKKILVDEGKCFTPTTFSKMYKEYESTTWKTGFAAKSIRKNIMKELQTNENLGRDFTLHQLVHLHFLLSVPVPEQREAVLRNSGALDLDEHKRIMNFESRNGHFKRTGTHPAWAARNARGNNDTYQEDTINEEAVTGEPVQKRRKTRSQAVAEVAAPEQAVIAAPEQAEIAALGAQSPRAQNPKNTQNALPPVEVEAPAQNQNRPSDLLNEVKAEVEDQGNDAAPEIKPDVAIINEYLLNSLKYLVITIDSPSLETLKAKILLAESRNNFVMVPKVELLSSADHCLMILSRGASLTKPIEECTQLAQFLKLLHLTLLQLGFDENLGLLQNIKEKSKEEKWIPVEKIAWAIESLFYTATPVADN